MDIKELKNSINIAEDLDDNELSEIASMVCDGFDIDVASRAEWQANVDEALKIAMQVREGKSHPWPNASNIKYPMITRASIDYASSILPQIIQNNNIVRTTVVGSDLDGSKRLRAKNVEQFMSYQLLQESDEWEEGTDKLLQILPVLGTVFKKVYYDVLRNRPISELCVPDKVVVNYNTRSLDVARRVTHTLEFYSNDIMERMRAGLYRDIPMEDLQETDGEGDSDTDGVIEVLEQHCYLDLDDDGYKEPYIVTVHKDSKQVLRIVHRFKKIHKNKEGEVQSIDPVLFFTDYHFIKSPDGGFYSMGFGTLLLPINAACNTLINQLIDAGTLNNSQGGFFSGLRIKNGEFNFKMGEWKNLPTKSGSNLRDSIFPMPTKEPSSTLFSLLGLLLEAGKDLSSSTDLMSGKESPQNVSQGTIEALMSQGAKMFEAINKRLYRGLKKEFNKIFAINSEFLTDKHYNNILDKQGLSVKRDFDIQGFDLFPVADPAMSTETVRLQKAQMLMNIPGLEPYELSKLQLEALNIDPEKIDILLPKPDPQQPPPPEVQKLLAETEKLKVEMGAISAQASLDSQAAALEMEKLKQGNKESEARIGEAMVRSWKMQEDARHNDEKQATVIAKMTQETNMKQEKQNYDIQSHSVQQTHDIDKGQAEIILAGNEMLMKAQEEKTKPKEKDGNK